MSLCRERGGERRGENREDSRREGGRERWKVDRGMDGGEERERDRKGWAGERHRIVGKRSGEEKGGGRDRGYRRRGVHYRASMGTQTTAYLLPFQYKPLLFG